MFVALSSNAEASTAGIVLHVVFASPATIQV
jgi:hypothetical protein